VVTALLLAILLPGSAQALEFRLDGYYRFQATVLQGLNLETDSENPSDPQDYFSHRLLLRPHLRFSPNVHVFMDIDVMDAMVFGNGPEVLAALGAVQESGDAFDEPLPLSESQIPGADYRESLIIRRAWAELYTPYVDLKVGRMGNHWGMGLFANDGNGKLAKYGDTVDRVMISTSRLDPVRLNLAFDMRSEGFINRNDDTHSFMLSGGYLSEVHQLGAYLRWTRQPSNSFNVIHADIFAATQLGPLSLQLEAMLLWGQARNTDIGVEELDILAGGGAFDAKLAIDPFEVGFQVGVASGDSNPADNTWNTLRFDRDHDVGLILFETAIPQLAVGEFADSENQNVDSSEVLVGDAVSNAFYLKPSFHISPLKDLELGVNFVAAFPVVPEAFGENAPDFYGAEVDLDLTYTLYGNFELAGEVGVFIPGPVFGEEKTPIIGGEVRALVHF
jgi:hypothetical protein